MPRYLALSFLLAICLTAVSTASGQTTQPAAPLEVRSAWWREAKFGMFVHWGIYSVPADSTTTHGWPGAPEWLLHGKQMQVADYEKFAPQFNPVDFDARAWARLARDAGMKYITTKHHDGFCMFDSKLTDYDIIDATPYKKDPLKDLAEACRAQGIKLQFYYSIMDWHHPDYLPRRPWDTRPADGADLNRYIDYMKGQLRELLTNYGDDIAGIWFDGGWEHGPDKLRSAEVNSFLWSMRPDLMINDRNGPTGDYDTPEQNIPTAPKPGRLWETCMTLNDYWGYARGDDSWKSTTDLTRKMIDIASKGGNFLLNVGPTERGVIPPESVERLQKVGAWMRVNGESIYGTTRSPYKRYDFNGRCTVKRNTLYVHVFGWPDAGATLRGLKSLPKSARLPDGGSAAEIRTETGSDGLSTVTILPPAKRNYAATVVAVEMSGAPDAMVVEPPLQPDGMEGWLELSAADATTHGPNIRVEKVGQTENLGWWTNKDDYASWEIDLPGDAPREFDVNVTYACKNGAEGATYTIASSKGDARVDGAVRPTGEWSDFRTESLGALRLAPGRQTISIRPTALGNGAVMNLAQIRLNPKR